MLAVARGSHSCAAETDLGTTTPRKKPGPENLGSGDETRELHKTRVFHQIFNAADGPEKSGFRACLTEIRPKPPSINPQTRKKSHNQNPGFARKTQVTHSPIPGLSRVSPRSRVFPGCLCCVLWSSPSRAPWALTRLLLCQCQVIRISLSVFRQVRQRTRSHPDSPPHTHPKGLMHPVDPPSGRAGPRFASAKTRLAPRRARPRGGRVHRGVALSRTASTKERTAPVRQ